jgi:large subunit ribosomal protein L19
VRRISYNVGCEKVFSGALSLYRLRRDVRRGKVARAKLYYLRDRRRQGGEDQGRL